jgi:hypothetical protein
MTCDDARVQLLREFGNDGEPEQAVGAQEHVSTCAPCAEYRRDAELVWQAAERGTESCPRRSDLLGGRRGSGRAGMAAAAAALIAAASLAAWAAWPARRGTVARQDRDADAEELLRKDPEFRKQVLRAALQEKERLVEFEKKLAKAEEGLAEAKKLLADKQAQAAAELAESTLGSFPYLKLAVIDAPETAYRSTVLKLRLREAALTAQLQLLKETPVPEGQAEQRTAVEVRVINQLRECLRSLEETTRRGPQPRKEMKADLGGAEYGLRAEALDKLRSIRLTVSMTEAPLIDVVAYLREITGLNIVLEGTKENRQAPVTIELQDAICEGVVEHVTKLARYSWEVDRFGIIVFNPAKK